MAADSPLALNLRDCYFRPSTRRTPRSQQRGVITGCLRVPRFESRMIDGNGSGGAVNPFAYSPPNPFLSRLGGGASTSGGSHHRSEAVQSQQDVLSSSSSSSSSSSVLPSLIHPPPLQAPLLNKNFSFSTPSSPRHGSSLSEDPHLISPYNAGRQEEENSSSSSYLSVLSPIGSGGVGPSSKRRRSIQIDGGIQAPPLGCSDGSFSSFSCSREDYLSASSSLSSASPLTSFPSKNAFSGTHDNGGEGIEGGGKELSSSSSMDLTALPAISVIEPPKNEGAEDTTMKVEEEGEETKKKKNEASDGGIEKSEATKPTVFIDSGCYSLCYHTAMTAPPPTLSMAPLSTHFANEDREARRRRKACMSVLRSVQSSLQSTPETSPHLGPSADPSTATFSSSTTSPFLSSSILPPPPPAVRQPFFPSAFADTSSSSSSLSGYRSSTDNLHTNGEKTGTGDRGGRMLSQHQRDVFSACGGGVCTPEKKEGGGGNSHQSLAPLAQLRLRPDFFSPCTLATLIGACVHAYDEIRSAYPPPEPAPRLCVLSLPALYGQLPPHLASTAVLLDTDAPFVGDSSKCLPIECSQCVFKSSSSSGSSGSSAEISSITPTQASSTQGGLTRHDVLPLHLHGEFDIIVCETRTVTVGAMENTAACIRALARERSSTSSSLHPGGASLQSDGLYSSGEGQLQGGSYCTSIEAATEALNSLSLHGRGEGRLGGYTPGPSVYTEKRALPPSTRVIMLSTCLLSPLVDDLLGLKQCPFQPYIPSSALSSLQLQCIYTNFTSFSRLQKHNDVDFSTRVRVRSKSKSGGGNQVSDRPSSFLENHSHDRTGAYLELTPGSKNSDTASLSSPIVGSDEMVARAMVIHTQEEERAAMRGQESGAEGVVGKGEKEGCLASEEDEETIQQESILLKAFDGLQLRVGTGFATAGKSGGEEGSHVSSLSQGEGVKMRPIVGACRGPTSLPSGVRTPDPRATMAGNGGVGLAGALSSALLQDSQLHTGGGRCEGVKTTAGRSQACKGITMRTGADADEDDGIDYELECGSHFGMASHDL